MLGATVVALAKAIFHWQSAAAGRSAVRNIVSVLALHGIKINRDTVLRRLREGEVNALADSARGPAASAAVLKSLRKLALGIALEKFRWRPDANNQAAEASMIEVIVRHGGRVELADLARCLREAELELRV